MRWKAEGTFENEFMGQQPTGEKGEPVYGIGIDRFEDGKVAESWTQWDTLRFMRNIGAMPETARSRPRSSQIARAPAGGRFRAARRATVSIPVCRRPHAHGGPRRIALVSMEKGGR